MNRVVLAMTPSLSEIETSVIPEIKTLDSLESKILEALTKLQHQASDQSELVIADTDFERERQYIQSLIQNDNGHTAILEFAEEILEDFQKTPCELSVDVLADCLIVHRQNGKRLIEGIRALTLYFFSPRVRRARKLKLRAILSNTKKNTPSKSSDSKSSGSRPSYSKRHDKGNAKSNKMTNQLKMMSKLLSSEIERVGDVEEIVQEDNETVKSTNEEYVKFSNEMNAAKGVLNVLKRRDKTDLLYIGSGFVFFTLCCLYIILKRLRMYVFIIHLKFIFLL